MVVVHDFSGVEMHYAASSSNNTFGARVSLAETAQCTTFISPDIVSTIAVQISTQSPQFK